MDTKTKNAYVVTKPFELDGKKIKQGSKVQLNYLEAGYWLSGGYLMPEHLVAEEPTQASTPQTEAPTQASTPQTEAPTQASTPQTEAPTDAPVVQ